MNEDKSIKDLLQEMNEKLEGKPKRKKGLWIPLNARVGKGAAKRGYVTIMKIMDNRNIKFERQPIEDQTIIVDGSPSAATSDETLFYKGKPFIIQPSWSNKPFSPTDNYDNTMKSEYSSHINKLILTRMQKEAIASKRKISGGVIFIIILVLIAGGYLLSRGGLF